MEINVILQGDALTKLKQMPDKSVNCCVTSHPYFNLRDYGSKGQIGLEKTPEAYIKKLVIIFREVKRVLKDDGTIWVNIGDSYAAYFGQKYGQDNSFGKDRKRNIGQTVPCKPSPNFKKSSFKPKDLIGIPWLLAFALRKDGWYLRQDIIWHKPNPIPESVTDRCTKAHEYIFLLSKKAKYYYDYRAIMVESKNPEDDIRRKNGAKESHKTYPDEMKNGIRSSWKGSDFGSGKTGEMMKTRGGRKSGNKERKPGSERGCPENTGSNVCSSVPWEGVKANKRSVWTVTTKPFSEAHFATFPPELIVDCIKAGCPVDGIVLDPFFGAGTTGVVARKVGRNFIGIELNEKYINDIALPRLRKELGLFL